ncbi:MAG: HEAT repeat domain-containing protein [Promethearchaeota archaeon]
MTDKGEIKRILSDLKSKDESKRKAAVFMAGEQRIKESVKLLIKILKEEKNKVIRNNAARALGKIRDPIAIDALTKALYDSDYYVRQSAAWALGKIGDRQAVKPLLNLIKDGGAKIYTSSGDATNVNVSMDNMTDILIEEGMKYHDVQIRAIQALGELKDETAIQPLINEFNDDEPQIRCAIALSLGKIGNKKAVPALINKLNDRWWYVRRDCAIALGKIGDLSALDALIEKLDDNYLDVAEKSAKAIEKLGKIAIAKAFLLKPNNEHIKKIVKSNFRSKQELKQIFIKIIDMEENEERKEEFKKKISLI